MEQQSSAGLQPAITISYVSINPDQCTSLQQSPVPGFRFDGWRGCTTHAPPIPANVTMNPHGFADAGAPPPARDVRYLPRRADVQPAGHEWRGGGVHVHTRTRATRPDGAQNLYPRRLHLAGGGAVQRLFFHHGLIITLRPVAPMGGHLSSVNDQRSCLLPLVAKVTADLHHLTHAAADIQWKPAGRSVILITDKIMRLRRSPRYLILDDDGAAR